MMRVSMKKGGYATSCETFAIGEVEDYTVNILPAKQADPLISKNAEILVYPNPAQATLFIDLSDFDNANKITCFDVNGVVVSEMIVSSEIVQLNIDELPAGMYFLVATNNSGERISSKFIKQ